MEDCMSFTGTGMPPFCGITATIYNFKSSTAKTSNGRAEVQVSNSLLKLSKNSLEHFSKRAGFFARRRAGYPRRYSKLGRPEAE